VRLSKAISIILHPVFMPIIALYLSINLVPNIRFSITNYIPFTYLVFVISTIIMPVITIMFLIKKKLVSSLEMSDYKERSAPLFITTLWMCYGYYKLVEILVLAPILKASLMSAIIITFIAFIISKYWKISLHMLGVGGVSGLLFSLNLLFGGLLPILVLSIFLSGILGVARINENAHNHTQIYTGFLLGFLIESFGVLLL